MGTPGRSRVQEMIARRRRRIRRLRTLLVLATLVGVSGHYLRRWAEQNRIFNVDVVYLVNCPDSLRPLAAQQAEPLLGRTVLDIARHSRDIRKEFASLPEVARADLRWRLPNRVELRLEPRQPELAVQAGGCWLSVDHGGRVVRSNAQPEKDLPQVIGLNIRAVEPGRDITTPRYTSVLELSRLCRRLLGNQPQAVGVEPGGGLRVRTASGDLVMIGEAQDMERKLKVYEVIREKLGQQALYIDVATPTAPAWRPKPPVDEEATDNEVSSENERDGGELRPTRGPVRTASARRHSG